MLHLTKWEQDLRDRILVQVKDMGFKVNPHLRLTNHTKQTYRNVQLNAKEAQVSEHRNSLLQFVDTARKFCLDGCEIDPEKIDLKLRPVEQGTFESKLFFWWNLMWWSMPYQASYGRRMRFILWDKYHNMPFGLFLLQSPMLRMKARDEYLGIPNQSADIWANQSMSAQRIGAIPPYNELIGGKMVALSTTSNEVRKAYSKKYKNKRTVMENRILESRLLFITTTGAFGKSSMYDRLKYYREQAAILIGQTTGIGTFHISDRIVQDIYDMLRRNGMDAGTGYGHGPSRKIQLLKRGFSHLGLTGFYHHGIQRNVYLFSLTRNLHNVIQRGRRPLYHDRPFDEIVRFWHKRWCMPRSKRTDAWHRFEKESFFTESERLLEA